MSNEWERCKDSPFPDRCRLHFFSPSKKLPVYSLQSSQGHFLRIYHSVSPVTRQYSSTADRVAELQTSICLQKALHFANKTSNKYPHIYTAVHKFLVPSLPDHQVFTLVPNNFGSSKWNFLHVTLLLPRVWAPCSLHILTCTHIL